MVQQSGKLRGNIAVSCKQVAGTTTFRIGSESKSRRGRALTEDLPMISELILPDILNYRSVQQRGKCGICDLTKSRFTRSLLVPKNIILYHNNTEPLVLPIACNRSV